MGRCAVVLALALANGAFAQKADPDIRKIVQKIAAKNIRRDIEKLVSFKTRHTLSQTNSATEGIGAAREWIKKEFEDYSAKSGGRLRIDFDSFVQPATNRVPNPTVLVNVVATLPGRMPESADRIYVVSGHYDSCVCAQSMTDATSDAPGANDDASGTAAVLEMARVMSAFEFDATIIFLAVAGEEQGLLGSGHFARAAREKNLNIAGMFTNDIIGSSRGHDGRVNRRRVRLFGEGVPPRKEMPADLLALLRTGSENDSPTRELARFIAETSKRYVSRMDVEIIYRTDRYGRGGDHSPFLLQGYPAVRFTEGAEDYTHQHQKVRVENGVKYGDLPEFVDFEYVAQIARVNASALASLAAAPAVPSNVTMDSRQGYDTILRWTENKEPDVAGYEVVWRKTTSPMWEHRERVGLTNSITLKDISKDDFIFGVGAFDRKGHLSPPAYPKAATAVRARSGNPN
jgi:hypothetical protein